MSTSSTVRRAWVYTAGTAALALLLGCGPHTVVCVWDAASGEPIANARVERYRTRSAFEKLFSIAATYFPEVLAETGVTDSDGVVTIRKSSLDYSYRVYYSSITGAVDITVGTRHVRIIPDPPASRTSNWVCGVRFDDGEIESWAKPAKQPK